MCVCLLRQYWCAYWFLREHKNLPVSSSTHHQSSQIGVCNFIGVWLKFHQHYSLQCLRYKIQIKVSPNAICYTRTILYSKILKQLTGPYFARVKLLYCSLNSTHGKLKIGAKCSTNDLNQGKHVRGHLHASHTIVSSWHMTWHVEACSRKVGYICRETECVQLKE